MPFSIIDFAALIYSVAVLVFITWGLSQTIGLFGRLPISEAHQMLLLVKKGRGYYVLMLAFLVLVTTPVIWVIGNSFSLPTYSFSVAIAILSSAILAIMQLVQPPTVLLLTGSSSKSSKLLQQINTAILPHKAVALLSFRSFDQFQRFNYFINLRTNDPDVWKSVVYRLIDISPLVVIDTRGDRHAVEEETFIMLDPTRVRKAIFLGGKDDTYPALAAYGIDPHQVGIKTVTEDGLMPLLKSLTQSSKYLPWPPPPYSKDTNHSVIPENFNTAPSIRFYILIDSFDSDQLVSEARASGKDLLIVILSRSRIAYQE